MKNLKGLIFSALVLGICLFVNPNTVFADSCTEENGSAKYSITTDSGSKYCTSLTDAFKEVAANGTITVLNADTISSVVKVSKSATLDLNGKKLTVTGNCVGLQIADKAINLTIKDSGTTGTITNNSSAVVLVAAGHLDLNGGTLESSSAAATIQIGHSSNNSYTGSMTMNGGTVYNKSTNGGYAINIVQGDLTVNKGTIKFDGKSTAILVGDNEGTVGKLTFNGGTVESKSVGVMIDKGSAKVTGGTITATTDGYSAVQLGSPSSGTDVSLEITGGKIEHTNTTAGNALLIAKSTATVKGGTIISNSGSAAIQVGEAGKNEAHLVMTGGTAENKTSAPAILVTYAKSDAKISGGTIKINEDLITDEKHNDVAISIGLDSKENENPGAKVTITDANITGGIGLFGNNPELDFQGGSVKAKSFAVSGNGAQTHNSKITISGGSLTSENSAAIYHPQTGTLNITNGNISGKIGVVARQGDVKVTGGDINATGKADEKIRVGDSKEGDEFVQLPTGVAIIVDNSNEKGYADDANVTITNGTINGNVDSLLSYGKTTSEEDEFIVSGGSFNNPVKTEYLVSNVQQSESGVVGKVHKITTTKSKNGTVKLPSNAAEGETVTVKYTADKGFVLDSIVVKKADGTKIKVVGGKFVMPAGDVTVTVTFKGETNPATGDNLLTYVSLGAIALISTLGTSLYLKKVNE